MTVPFVVPAYAGLLALIYVFLSIRVSRLRGEAKAMIGTGGDPRLELAIRAHGNFAEYVPLALLLLGFMEMQRSSSYVLHGLSIALFLARLLHAVGISRTAAVNPSRFIGTFVTDLVIIVAAIALIVDYFRIAAL